VEVLIFGKVRIWRFLVLCVVSLIDVLFAESPRLPRLFSFCTISSTLSVASVILRMHSVRSARAHVWLVGAILRSVWTIPRGIGLSLCSSGAHDCRNFLSVRSLPSSWFNSSLGKVASRILCDFWALATPGCAWLMIAFVTRNSNLVPLFESLCSSNPCRFEILVFWRFCRNLGTDRPRYDQISYFYIVSDVWSSYWTTSRWHLSLALVPIALARSQPRSAGSCLAGIWMSFNLWNMLLTLMNNIYMLGSHSLYVTLFWNNIYILWSQSLYVTQFVNNMYMLFTVPICVLKKSNNTLTYFV